MLSPASPARSPLYEQLAQDLLRQIEAGTFRPGQRIPSVRQTSQQRRLSVTTVLQAYQLLEDRGVVEARPQSGYFVRLRPAVAALEPPLSSFACSPCDVSIDDIYLNILSDAQRTDLVQFGAAIPDPALLPIRKINTLLAQMARGDEFPHHLCGTPEGCEEIRVQIAQRALTSGCSLAPDDLIVTSGCMEAMHLSLRAVCKPGDLVAIESPTYFNVLQALEACGLRALEIPTHPATGLSLEALRFALEHNPVRAALVVTNFSNPTGALMPDENKRELVKMLAEREIPLIEDDIYGELYFDGQRPQTAKSYDENDLVLLCSSFSKDISPGFRVGWVAPGRFKKQVQRLKMATNVGTALLPQYVIARFLATGGYDHHLRRMRRAYAQRMAEMRAAVLRYFPEETRVTNPRGGFVLWVQLPEKVDSLVLYRQALAAGISLTPGPLFSTTEKYRHFIRLNSAFMNAETQGAVKQLGQLVQRLAK